MGEFIFWEAYKLRKKSFENVQADKNDFNNDWACIAG